MRMVDNVRPMAISALSAMIGMGLALPAQNQPLICFRDPGTQELALGGITRRLTQAEIPRNRGGRMQLAEWSGMLEASLRKWSQGLRAELGG